MMAWRVHESGPTNIGAVLPIAQAREAHFKLEGLRPRPKGKSVLVGSAS
jgi:hypothetical protein